MKFRAWASEDIREWYLKMEEDGGLAGGLAGLTEGQIKELVLRMLTDEDIRPVWDAWRRVYPEKLDVDGECFIPRDLVLFGCVILSLQLFHDSLPPSEGDIGRLEETIKHAKGLARALDKNQGLMRVMLNNIATRSLT